MNELCQYCLRSLRNYPVTCTCDQCKHLSEHIQTVDQFTLVRILSKVRPDLTVRPEKKS